MDVIHVDISQKIIDYADQGNALRCPFAIGINSHKPSFLCEPGVIKTYVSGDYILIHYKNTQKVMQIRLNPITVKILDSWIKGEPPKPGILMIDTNRKVANFHQQTERSIC